MSATRVLPARARARRWGLWAMVGVYLCLGGCGKGGSASESEQAPVLLYFNQHLMPGVLLNAPLVFTFNTPLDPQTVNSSTIQIWTTIKGKRVDAPGTFVVQGKTVTWLPQMTSKVYPLATNNTKDPIMPDDAGLNTAATAHFVYNVFVPAPPIPNTVRSLLGKPIRRSFSSMFETADGPQVSTPGNTTLLTSLFDKRAPYFRDTIRVADVLAYGGTTSPPKGFLGWLANPGSTLGENPLYLNPSLLQSAMAQWTNRDRTGAQVDKSFHIQLVPPLTPADMKQNLLPPGIQDERFIANLKGTRRGRGREVQGLNIYFSQPIAPDSFLDRNNNPKTYQQSPIQVRVLTTPNQDPSKVTPRAYTLTFINDPKTQTAFVNLTFTKAIRVGWLHITIRVQDVKGIPGGSLEANLSGDFVFLWPVWINAL